MESRPRWFKNLDFGTDLTNVPFKDIVEEFQNNFEKKIDQVTFDSTGPIIEEVLSEDEEAPLNISEALSSHSEAPQDPSASHISAALSHHSEAPQDEELLEELSVPGARSPTPIRCPTPTKSPTPARSFTPATSPPAGRPIRTKFRPLDFARGERIRYNRHGDILEVEKGFPAFYNYGRKTKTINTARPQTKLPKNVKMVEQPPIKSARKGDYQFSVGAIANKVTGGSLILGPSKTKPTAKTAIGQTYFFTVKEGQVIFKIEDHNKVERLFADKNSGWISLGSPKRYTIKNHGKSTAHVAYIVVIEGDDE